MSIVGLLLPVMRLLLLALGLSKSRCDRNFLPHMSSEGEDPVELCGVIRYLIRKRESLAFWVPNFDRFIPSLNVCTALSTRPLEAGWYGGALTCRMPFRFTNYANSSLVNIAALSETIVSGRPRLEKVFLINSIVTADVAEFIACTSNHLECASINRRNIFPSKGPA